MIEFWSNYIETLSKTKINFSNYKTEDIITSLPLYAVDIINEYEQYVEYVNKNFHLFEDKLRNSQYMSVWKYSKNQWIYSMYPDIRGFAFYPNLFFENIRRRIGDIETSLPNITSSHHFFKYIELTGKSPLDYGRIVELGGGLGDMSLFFRNMGYGGKYVIYDLPEVNKIQNVSLCNYEITITNEIPEYQEDTLFISTWGFSECPMDLRKEVIEKLKPENWLIIYQREFQNINNQKYFSNWDGYRYDMNFVDYDGGSEMICK